MRERNLGGDVDNNDSGHGIKMIRALAAGEKISREYSGAPGFEAFSGDMWWKLAAMRKTN